VFNTLICNELEDVIGNFGHDQADKSAGCFRTLI
jgi:hypothetical protein